GIRRGATATAAAATAPRGKSCCEGTTPELFERFGRGVRFSSASNRPARTPTDRGSGRAAGTRGPPHTSWAREPREGSGKKASAGSSRETPRPNCWLLRVVAERSSSTRDRPQNRRAPAPDQRHRKDCQALVDARGAEEAPGSFYRDSLGAPVLEQQPRDAEALPLAGRRSSGAPEPGSHARVCRARHMGDTQARRAEESEEQKGGEEAHGEGYESARKLIDSWPGGLCCDSSVLRGLASAGNALAAQEKRGRGGRKEGRTGGRQEENNQARECVDQPRQIREYSHICPTRAEKEEEEDEEEQDAEYNGQRR
ncbi:unnamed protein product, partial [Prorocentrum cordatum]